MAIGPDHRDEEAMLRAVLHQNAESIFLARQRAERDLEIARQALEARTAELAAAVSMMQATLESTADGIVATDEAGRVTVSNERFRRMWSLPDELVAAGDHRALVARIMGQLRDELGHRRTVDRILHEAPQESFDVMELADGRVFERFTRVQILDGRVVGRVWSYRDVTDRAHAVAELEGAKTQAEAASRAKSAFLAMTSHELRTPLNAIAGYAQIMEMGIHGPLTEEQRHALLRIQASQRHLLSLIDAVLLHAKLETGMVGFHLGRVPAAGAMSDAEALVAPQAWARHLTLVVHPADPEVAVRADRGRLQQILVNLLSNAVKFTEPGGRIDLACEPCPDGIRFQVRDTGIGIPAEQLEAIFEPFVQVRSELTRTAEGTGLGLAISRALARGMDGSITVESTVGQGSTFTLTLTAP